MRFLILTVGLAILSLTAFKTEANLEDKIYIDSHSVLVGSNGIFAKLDEEIFQIKSLNYDQSGPYINLSDIYPEVAAWYCTTCNKHRVRHPCPGCGKEGPDNPWKDK